MSIYNLEYLQRLLESLYTPYSRSPALMHEEADYIIFSDDPSNPSMYYVKDGRTGAIAGSSSDFAQLLQNTINSLNARGGGKIYLKPGNYYVKTAISIDKAQGIVIAGSGAKLIANGSDIFWQTTYYHAIFEIYNASDIEISGIEFIVDAPSDMNNARAPSAIRISGPASNIKIFRCRFSGSTNPYDGMVGVVPRYSGGNVSSFAVINSVFRGIPNTHSIKLFPPTGSGIIYSDILVLGNRFENVMGYTIYLDSYSLIRDVKVVGNTFIDLNSNATGDAGLYATAVQNASGNPPNSIDGVLIIGNYYRNSLTNIRQGFVHFYNIRNIRIIGNIAIGAWPNAYGPAFALGSVKTPISHVEISSNYVEGFDSFWDPDSMTHVLVEGNTIINCGGGLSIGYGIQKYVVIRNNIVYNTNGYLGGAIVFGNSTPVKCRISYNLIIDDRNPPAITRAFVLTGNFSFSDCIADDNIIYVPNGSLTYIYKEFGGETPPMMMNNIIHDSTGKRYEKNAGVATIPAGSNRVTVQHQLAAAPSKVLITPLGPGAPIWVENITSTSFDIVVGSTLTAALNIAWYAEV